MPGSVALVVPGSLDSRTGGYIYDRHVADGLRAGGWSVDVQSLDESFPQPTASALAHAAEVLAALSSGTITLIDSLALGAMPEVVERHASRLRIVALMHLPLAADVGIDEVTAARLAAAERRALATARLVIVTGRATLPLLAPYDLPPARIVIVEPGTDPAPLARGSGGSPLRLLSVATLNPGKGYEDLLAALSAVPSPNWQLTCAGSLTRHPPTATRIKALIQERHQEDRVSLEGDLDAAALETLYDRADVFVLATRRETYGMAVAEALAHGLPVVSTTTGAIPDLVGSDAGVLVPPGDVPALTEALSRVIGDGDLRARLSSGARRARLSLQTWDVTTANVAAALDALSHG